MAALTANQKRYRAEVKRHGVTAMRKKWREEKARRRTLGTQLAAEISAGEKHIRRAEKLTGNIAFIARIAATTKQ